ncbi:RBBP9/YdeN family alpha/beta hydrolase [Rhodococcus sovatensis]|uniref:Alpha/beta fold hydrolase n=1 Tax=Rhodococcus sovatensis TaxID=1805840 RepID=A0ABZ2PPV2_9NOCA
MRRVMVPGLGGSDESHWQSHWESEGEAWTRIEPASWDAPDVDDWTEALHRSVGDTVPILVAHSLGCLAAVKWSHLHNQRVAGLFLVAPPDPHGDIFPAIAAQFGDDLDEPIPVPTLVVTSSDDPYCAPERAQYFAVRWGAAHVDVGLHGHLNSASGLDGWTEGRNLFTAFAAGIAQ